MQRKTRGESEAEFTQAIIKLEKEYLGRGPSDARTFLINDLIIVRLRGLLAPAELKLAETDEGKTLVKTFSLSTSSSIIIMTASIMAI